MHPTTATTAIATTTTPGTTGAEPTPALGGARSDPDRGPGVSRGAGDRGQSTAEYALVLLGAAAVALAFLAWAGGTGRIADLFNAVIDSVIGSV